MIPFASIACAFSVKFHCGGSRTPFREISLFLSQWLEFIFHRHPSSENISCLYSIWRANGSHKCQQYCTRCKKYCQKYNSYNVNFSGKHISISFNITALNILPWPNTNQTECLLLLNQHIVYAKHTYLYNPIYGESHYQNVRNLTLSQFLTW